MLGRPRSFCRPARRSRRVCHSSRGGEAAQQVQPDQHGPGERPRHGRSEQPPQAGKDVIALDLQRDTVTGAGHRLSAPGKPCPRRSPGGACAGETSRSAPFRSLLAISGAAMLSRRPAVVDIGRHDPTVNTVPVTSASHSSKTIAVPSEMVSSELRRRCRAKATAAAKDTAAINADEQWPHVVGHDHGQR